MVNRIRILCILGGLLFVGLTADAGPTTFSDELDATDYDCSLSLEPAAKLSDRAAVRVLLEWDRGKNYTQVTVTRDRIEVAAVANGKQQLLAQMDAGVTPGEQYQVTILRRGLMMGILHKNVLIGHGDVPRSAGTLATIAADAGWKVLESHVQRIEPVIFSDDFMRTNGEESLWTKVSGHWALKSAWEGIPHGTATNYESPDQAQNPFAWVGKSQANQPAICTTGNAFWEDYTFSVAVNPGKSGAAGILVNLTDARNGLLLRWSPANDRKPDGNQLTLYKLTNGTRTRVASDPGGYVPGQWYRLSVVTSLGTLRVLVDGRERMFLKSVTPWRGGIGLYAEGTADTIFDDVTVYGQTLNADTLYETQQSTIGQRFLNDPNGMKEWAINIRDWVADNFVSNFRWYRQDLFGNHTWMTMTITPAANATGELWMTLNGNGKEASSGYRAVMQLAGSPLKLTYTLFRDATELAKKTVPPLAAGTEYSLHFWHVGNRLWLEVDGEKVIEATDTQPLHGLRPAYRNYGPAFAKVSDIQVLGRHTLDYTFSDAPTDWLATGTWMPTIRWSCTPQWSFLGGWSRGDAVLWHKHRFTGDHAIEAFVSTKMDYYRETDVYYNRQGNFAVTLCGDGKEPRNGYAGIYGYPDANGAPLGRAVIMRNGEIVAAMPVVRRSWAANHRAWIHLQMSKRGNVIVFTTRIANEVYTLTYTDDTPINDGIPAVWTYDNATNVARVRLDFAQLPTPRTDPQVVIATPWYPEWANIGMPQTLDISESWSTTGKPIRWQVTPSAVPAGDDAAATIKDGTLIFAPKQPGKHWYRVTARDQEHQSPDFHLSQMVFNPALKRDDSHALVLYRFNEGTGTTVRDHSLVTPLPLTIKPEGENFAWVPGQGVRLQGGAKPLRSAASADKLMAIQQTKACTFEVWQSAETLFGPFGRSGCFFTWEPDIPPDAVPPTDPKAPPLTVPNFGLSYTQDHIVVATGGSIFQVTPMKTAFPGFLTSLHHIMLTWDGATTTCYFDGVKLGESTTPWNLDKWVHGAPLFVGNQPDGKRQYPGSLYLVAVHDRCFTADEVVRHYQAGPSAK